jgi:thiamine-phosphate pyrophosphorylase
MPKAPDRRVLRVLDANFNRSREGLRVCEEIFRFLLNDAGISGKLKRARHGVTRLMKKFPAAPGTVLAARDVRGDSGRKPTKLGSRRSGPADLFSANIERAKESLRVLEEFTKLVDRRSSDGFKKLRFQIYAIEKQAVPKLESLRDHRRGGRGRRSAH